MYIRWSVSGSILTLEIEVLVELRIWLFTTEENYSTL